MLAVTELAVMAHSHCMGSGNDGFLYYAIYYSHYTGTGKVTIIFYCTCLGPGPCPVPGPVQCE